MEGKEGGKEEEDRGREELTKWISGEGRKERMRRN